MWTLAVEVCFYLLLPLLGWLALRAKRARRPQMLLPILLLTGGVIFNSILSTQGGAPLGWSKSLPAMLPYFAVGMLAAVVIEGRRPDRRSALLWTLGGLALVAIDLVMHLNGVPGLSVIRDLPAAAGFSLIVAVAAARPAAALEWRPLVSVGSVSYGLYLWHVPVLLVLRANGLLPLDAWGATLIALPVSLLAGWLSLKLVEQPAMAWSRRTNLLGANVSSSAR